MNDALTIELNDHWHDFIATKVASGTFRSSEDVLRAALCLLEEEESRVDRLAALLDEGERSGEWASWDYQAFLAEMHRDDRDREAA